MFANFNEIPAMTFQGIKETKHYGWMGAQTDKVKTVYPPQTKFAGAIKSLASSGIHFWIEWEFKIKYIQLILTNSKSLGLEVLFLENTSVVLIIGR